ncbi:MAG: hypothetical protein CM15mP93_16970 [Thiotrichaceae bacterium]|nr:MAG: hypothetical protein CM15mP93_16970 [Thiotrichaceae bacterium]
MSWERVFSVEKILKVLHGENIKKPTNLKFYEKSLDKKAEDLENR